MNMTVISTTQLDPQLCTSCKSRLDGLRNLYDSKGVDALLVSCEKDIRYLTGFVGHDSQLLVMREGAVIFSDARYDEFLNPWREAGFVEIVMGRRHRIHQSVKEHCAAGGVKRLGVQADSLTVSGRQTLASNDVADSLVDTVGMVAGLRMIKDDLEIAVMERAIRIQQDALAATMGQLTLGMTELELYARLDYEMRMRGAFGSSFDAIIGAGTNSSIIHYLVGDSPIERGTLLVDWGAEVDGYCGDLTRTFGIGEFPEKVRDMYDIVLEAQLAAIEATGPGKICAEIDAAARKVITEAGYGDYFGHGLGHGLGMDVHEAPYFNDLQTEVELQPGMVMTFEPGIYVPGVGGVRIEDDVLITESGTRVLSDYPKSITDMIIEPGSA